MQQVTTKAMAKVAAVATGLAMATSMLSLAPIAHAASLTSSQVSAIISLLQSFGADSATIANVQASLTGGTPASSGSGSVSGSCSFTGNLTIGSKGSQVTCLQKALIAGGYSVPAGATGYFGSQTKTAVVAWQKAVGVSPASGYFGSISRAHWNLGGSSTGGSTGGTTGGTVSAGTGTGLKVALSATSPNGSVLVQGQGIGDLGDYTFSNPTASPINVTNLVFNRTGASNDSTLTNIYLYSGGTRLTDSVGITNSQFTFNSPSPLFTVPAGGVYTVSVRSDILSTANGQQIGVSLVSAASNGTLDSSVSFPINSGFQTVSAATLAAVDYTVANATPTSAITVSAQNDYPVWQDNVSVSTNPVKLTSLRFTNLGSADSSAITNLRLYVDGTQAGPAIPVLGADRIATFDLSAAPLTLSESTHVVKILANITNVAASRTVQFSVQRSSDGMFVDSELGQPVTPTSAAATFAAVSTGIITIQSASAGVSVSKSTTSRTENVSVGATNVNWASFDMLASGENVKVIDLFVYASSTKSTGALDGVGGLDNGKVLVNGVQVGSTKDIGSLAAAKTDFSLGSSLILPAGVTTKVDIYGDAKDTAGTNLSNNGTVIVSLAVGSSNGQGISSLTSTNVPAAITSGNTVTVTSASLTATSYSGYGNQTIIAGQNNARIGAFTLSTGSTEGVLVNTIGIKFANAVSSTITNLSLKDDATGALLGTTITTPGATAAADNAFSVNLDIPSSSTKTIDVYANVLSSANAGTLAAQVNTTTTGTGDSSGQTASIASAVTLQTMTLGSGTLTLTTGAGDPTSDNVLAGASSVHVGQFQFAASNSSWTVQKLDVLVPDGQATSVSNITLSYKDVNGATQSVTQALTVSGNNAFATASFTGLTFYVPSNDSSNVDVYAGTPLVANGATSGTGVNITLDAGTTGTFKAIDAAGSATTTINVAGADVASNGTFYVRKSIPTFAIPSGQGGSIAPVNPLYRFSVTADPAGAIEWTKLTFSIATTTATVSGISLINEAAPGVNLLDNNTSSASTTKTTITVDLTQNSTQPKFEQVAAGQTKTYDLNASTITGFTTGSTVSIHLSQDTATAANGTASAKGTGTTNNVVWSDRSATSHTVSTSDWTNGYLLRNFTTNTVQFSK